MDGDILTEVTSHSSKRNTRNRNEYKETRSSSIAARDFHKSITLVVNYYKK